MSPEKHQFTLPKTQEITPHKVIFESSDPGNLDVNTQLAEQEHITSDLLNDLHPEVEKVTPEATADLDKSIVFTGMKVAVEKRKHSIGENHRAAA
jgi:hypothetical protein